MQQAAAAQQPVRVARARLVMAALRVRTQVLAAAEVVDRSTQKAALHAPPFLFRQRADEVPRSPLEVSADRAVD
jgi:hypothetical protein